VKDIERRNNIEITLFNNSVQTFEALQCLDCSLRSMLGLGVAHLRGLGKGIGKESIYYNYRILSNEHISPPYRWTQSEESSTINARGRGGGVDLLAMM
jgi:hypothetical protein